jgi:hypothetical protein
MLSRIPHAIYRHAIHTMSCSAFYTCARIFSYTAFECVRIASLLAANIAILPSPVRSMVLKLLSWGRCVRYLHRVCHIGYVTYSIQYTVPYSIQHI